MPFTHLHPMLIIPLFEPFLDIIIIAPLFLSKKSRRCPLAPFQLDERPSQHVYFWRTVNALQTSPPVLSPLLPFLTRNSFGILCKEAAASAKRLQQVQSAGRMEQDKKSIFSKRPEGNGGLSLNSFAMGNGRFNIREIAEQVKMHGSVDFEFEEGDMEHEHVKPPQPFQRRFGKWNDCYDQRDPNSPEKKTTDYPSVHFHRCVRQVAGYPATPDAFDLVTKDGGVRKRVLKEGAAASLEEQVTDGCRVWIHYETYQDNGLGQPLILVDSTTDHEMAASLQVGNEGLPGLQFGLKTMRVGEVAEFAISPVYAYGENGIYGFIPKNQHLRMVVELREVKQDHRKPMTFMTQAEKQTVKISLDDVFQEVDELIKAGNAKFEKGLYRDACDRYNWALDLFQDHQCTASDKGTLLNDNSSTTDDAAVQIDHKCYQIYSNLGLCLLRLWDYEEAEKACQSALQLHHQRTDLRPKVLYRLAMAMYKQDKFQQCNNTCVRALVSASWGHAQFRDLKYKVQSALERRQAREKVGRQESGWVVDSRSPCSTTDEADYKEGEE